MDTKLSNILDNELTPAITKVIFYLWFPEPIANSAASLQDALMKVWSGRARDINRLQSQITHISEKIVEKLEKVLERELINKASVNREFIVLTLSKTLSQVELSYQVAIKVDLDGDKLYEYVNKKYPIQESSEDEKQIYEKSLKEICVFIIDFIVSAPDFRKFIESEHLKNERFLIDIAEAIFKKLDEVKALAIAQNSNQKFADFETKYRMQVKRKLNYLELAGIDLRQSIIKDQPLSVAYVTCNLKLNKRSNTIDESKNSTINSEDTTISVDKALETTKRLLILGMAGSGKTTFLRWVSIQAATNNFKDELSILNSKIPFFIPLRMIEGKFPAPEDFAKYVAPNLVGAMPEGWVHEKLHLGEAILLIDGIDEISERIGLSEWLQDLVESFPDIHIIVTSRPASAEVNSFKKLNFDEAELQPMSLQDIYVFIDRWHNAATENLTNEEKELGKKQSERLKLIIRDRRQIRSLATNPLLCAMLCILHRDRNGQIPSDRIELYNACCDMLIYRRDSERQIQIRSYPNIPDRQKRFLIQKIAYHMILNELSEISFEEAEKQIINQLALLEPKIPSSEASNILKMLLERSGILREPIEKHIDFAHRTFQEFLAAEEIISRDDIGNLIKNALDDKWREVVILAAGCAGENKANEIVKRLLHKGDETSDHQQRMYYLIAIACLETLLPLEPDVRSKINDKVAMLVPPQNMTDAKTLAAAGNLAVNALARLKIKTLGATKTAATVRTLALIGDAGALALIEKIAFSEKRQTVIRELIRGFEYFDDGVDYSKRVLSTIPIEFIRTYNLGVVQHLTKAQHIAHDFFYSDIDLTAFNKLMNLNNLSLISHAVDYKNIDVDFSPLSDLEKLEELTLRNISDTHNFSSLGKNTKIKNLSISSFKSNLKILNLGSIPELEKISIYCSKLILEGEQPSNNQLKSISINLFDLADKNDVYHVFSKLINGTHIDNLEISLNEKSKLDLTYLKSSVQSINVLGLRNCELQGEIRNIARYIRAIHLFRVKNIRREYFRGIENVTTLLIADFDREELVDLSEVNHLENLYLLYCRNLKYLGELQNLKSLKRIILINCSSVLQEEINKLKENNIKILTERSNDF